MRTSINDRFLEAFRHTGLTSNGLASRIGINSRSMYNYTNARRNPSDRCVRLLCREFPEISEDYILYGTDSLIRTDNASHEAEPERASTSGLNRKIESIYERIVELLSEQLRISNDRCTSLEEQNRILAGLIPD